MCERAGDIGYLGGDRCRLIDTICSIIEHDLCGRCPHSGRNGTEKLVAFVNIIPYIIYAIPKSAVSQ